MLKNGCKMVVISLGQKGAMLITKKETIYATAPKVKPISVVGAGDSMIAGMALKIVQGGSTSEMLRFGVAGGTAAVLTPGTELCKIEGFKRILPKVEIKVV